MSNLGVYYIQDTETKEIIKVNLTDSKYVNTEFISVWIAIKNFCRDLKFILFTKDKGTPEEIRNKIDTVVINIYEEYNNSNEGDNVPLINYRKEIFKEEDEVPNYIM